MVTVKNIGIFGACNVGKSSLANILTGQEMAIVSQNSGTTTDPVKKRMEIFGVGPCNIIDTAGIDDSGDLGALRVKKSLSVADQTDVAIVVFTDNFFAKRESDLLTLFNRLSVPVVLVHNKSDIIPLDPSVAADLNTEYGVDVVEFSCTLKGDEQQEALQLLTYMIIKALASAEKYEERPILEGFVKKNDTILLVCPIDSQAPQKRLILPQVMAIRDILDNGAEAVVLQPDQLENYLQKNDKGKNIKLVVTDSQAFAKVNSILPATVPLTSFSILLARSKGPFKNYLEGLQSVNTLKNNSKILILESCTHQVSCEDIGRVKIPAMLKKHLSAINGGADVALEFDYVQGLDDMDFSKDYSLAIQCGGCMVTKKQLITRVEKLMERKIPVVNYGLIIAYLSGITDRVVYEPARE